ncbi:SDR family oxidoreductase [Synoicihabitans lomoniglobus]|uniref:SDR family oxidoreductase n=1 Tax=Synoicihabitans lomoniglobus TaxID=2909285 RepID=A0AAF0CRV5_9BACT|nr:SDR family oxidoreductase [Opitutaceae bacterium LMO-M01]WED66935.1 SDR family oxidoreductase [Opitutaceae bacterium LMO-M01]
MNILFIGGTGIISTACTSLALSQGHEVAVLNRGQRAKPSVAAEHLQADLTDDAAVRAVLGNRSWDAVVDFTVFTPADLERRLIWLGGQVGQYVFISSASAYQKPPSHYLITEETPLENPYWQYSRDKIACEHRLMQACADDQFPGTIVRPSLTFGDDQVTLAMNSWQRSYTAIDRLRRGLPVIIPGDGRTLWTITHNTDFAQGLLGLLGRTDTHGEAFHITSDEVLTWNQIFTITAEAAGVAQPEFVTIPAEFIGACLPDEAPGLVGDKLCSSVFDNTKIKRFVPGFAAKTSYREGITRTLAWFDADPARQLIDAAENAQHDRLITAYRAAIASGLSAFHAD